MSQTEEGHECDSYIEESLLFFQKALYFINKGEEFLRVALLQREVTQYLPSFCARSVHGMLGDGAITVPVFED